MTSLDKIKTRELIVKLYFEDKKSVREIAKLLGIGKSSVSVWTQKYKNNQAFEDLPRSGRPSQFTKEQFGFLKEKLKVKPSKKRFDGQSLGWTTKMVKELIKDEFEIEISTRHVTRILKNLDFSLQKPRSQHTKDSKLARLAFKEDMGKKTSKQLFWIQNSNV